MSFSFSVSLPEVPDPSVPLVTSVLTQSSSGFTCHINRTNVFDTLAICRFFSKEWGDYHVEVAKWGSRKSWREEQYFFFF
jgi:hypothetical protein